MKPQRLPIVVAGLSHDHVFWILRSLNHAAVEVVGFYETDRALAQRYADRFGFAMDLVDDDLPRLLDRVRPAAVAAFGPIFDHLAVVEACAPRGIHVMVEKPLAVSVEHADRMAELAARHSIHLLTNFETSWYASTYAAYQRVITDHQVGAPRKVVVHDGHCGPRELGCTEAFLAWLTDPVLNGGGALIDFGCYGANLITWLRGGEAPATVTAVTQTIKPEVYPRVDDEATLVLTYPDMTGIIQGSWNWPVGRKDMEIYGQTGYVIAADAVTLRVRLSARAPEETVTLPPLTDPCSDPFAYLAGVVAGQIVPPPFGLYSLENNRIVVQILDAARRSAHTGCTVRL